MEKKPKKTSKDKKIKKNISDKSKSTKSASLEDTKKIFLKKMSDHSIEPPSFYSVEEKFSDTKKNINYLGFVVLFSFCLLLIGFSFFIINFFEERQEKIKFNMETFSTIDIEKVLKEAGNFKNELFENREKLEKLEERRKIELSQAETLYNARLASLTGGTGISSELERAKRAEFSRDFNSAKNKINGKYEPEIKTIKEEIKALSQKVSELDQQALDQAVRNNDFLDYQKKLFNSRIETIEENYRKDVVNLSINYENQIQRIINSFNPTRVSAKVEKVIQSNVDESKDLAEVNLAKLDKNSIYYSSLTNFQKQKADVQVILDRLGSIKFYNKTREMIESLDVVGFDVFTTVNEVYGKAKEQGDKFALSKELMDFYLEENGLTGMVIFVEPNDRVILYINALYNDEGLSSEGFLIDKSTRNIIGEFQVMEKSDLFYSVNVTRKSKAIEALTPVVFK